MAQIQMTGQEAKQVVKGLMVLRDRAYSSYRNHKDPKSETAQNNLKLYEELDALRVRIQQDAWAQSDLKKVFDRV